MAYEAIIEVEVVSDEYPVVHEPHEAVRDLGEYRCAADHLVCDARDLGYLGRDGSLRIHKGMPLVDDLMVADLHGSLELLEAIDDSGHHLSDKVPVSRHVVAPLFRRDAT
jgi:hypothetical protein